MLAIHSSPDLGCSNVWSELLTNLPGAPRRSKPKARSEAKVENRTTNVLDSFKRNLRRHSSLRYIHTTLAEP